MATLIEELEQATWRLKCAEYTGCFGCPGCALSAALRARIARIRGMMHVAANPAVNDLVHQGYVSALARLTGPLDPKEPK